MMYGLDTSDIEKIREVFKRHKEVEKVLIYGSRAKGNHKPYSDIDLTLIGDRLDLSKQFAVETDLNDLLIPYKMDITVLSMIENKNLLDHIFRVGQLFYKKVKIDE